MYGRSNQSDYGCRDRSPGVLHHRGVPHHVRMALQRYAMDQPRVTQTGWRRSPRGQARLDTAQAEGRWPGAYRSVWEQRLFVKSQSTSNYTHLIRHHYRRSIGGHISHGGVWAVDHSQIVSLSIFTPHRTGRGCSKF